MVRVALSVDQARYLLLHAGDIRASIDKILRFFPNEPDPEPVESSELIETLRGMQQATERFWRVLAAASETSKPN